MQGGILALPLLPARANAHSQAQATGCRQNIEVRGAVDLQEQDGSMARLAGGCPLRAVFSPGRNSEVGRKGESAVPKVAMAPSQICLGSLESPHQGSCEHPADAPQGEGTHP